MKSLGLRLKHIRISAGKNQKQVADDLEMTQGMISAMERGEGDPKLSTMRRIAKYYGVPLSALLADEMPPPPKPREPTKEEILTFMLGRLNLGISDTRREAIRLALEAPEETVSQVVKEFLSKRSGTA